MPIPIPGLLGLLIIGASILIAGIAKRSGRSSFNWFVISLLITPLGSALMLVVLNMVKDRGTPKEQKGAQGILKKKLGWRFWLILGGVYILTCIIGFIINKIFVK